MLYVKFIYTPLPVQVLQAAAEPRHPDAARHRAGDRAERPPGGARPHQDVQHHAVRGEGQVSPDWSRAAVLSCDWCSRVLGVVFSAFIVCWAPFFIMNLVSVACGQSCEPPAVLGTYL